MTDESTQRVQDPLEGSENGAPQTEDRAAPQTSELTTPSTEVPAAQAEAGGPQVEQSSEAVGTGPASPPEPPQAPPPAPGPSRQAEPADLIAFGAAAVVLAVLLTLGIVALVNGGLRFGRASQVDALSVQVATQASNVQDLNGRVDALQGIGPRMDAVETEVSGLHKQNEQLGQQVVEMQTQVATLQGQVETLQQRTNAFQAFLDGLRSLLQKIPGS